MNASTPTRLRVDAAQAGQTLSAVVRAMLPEGSSWRQARELCKYGKVRRNGQIERDAALRLLKDDEVEIDPTAPRLREHALDDASVIYLDRQIVVVNKPAGLLSVPFDEGDRNTLADRVRFWLRRKDGGGSELGVVQRLDKDTTGLLVFARSLVAKRALQQLFRRHTIERRYLAIAHGDVNAARFESDLIADRGDGLRGSFGHFRRPRGPLPREAQHAITEVRPIERLHGASLIECRLETGRQHQIRIHLSEAGHPLVGEPVYTRDFSGKLIAAARPMLHAAVLGFEHPSQGRPMHFEEPPPPDFEAMLTRLRT
jgi:23S rRNA pseudouridine1911/1915/1917 synthase